MKPSKNAIDLIKKWEGLKLEAYLCSAKVPTIGYGITYYPDGKKVKLGEKISMKKADELIKWHIDKIASKMPVLNVNQNQYDALVSFTYNLGITNLLKSILLKKVKANPNDPLIKDEFLKWKKAGGKVVQGLLNRRIDEYNLYAQK